MRGATVGRGLIMALALLAFLAGAVPAQATLKLTPAFTGGMVDLPMYVTSPPGDSHRLFIVTRTGVIRVAVDGVLQPTPFLDISDRVASDPNTEEGMASMAFDPGYNDPNSPGHGLFYVYFSALPTATETYGAIHVEEFHADRADPNTADPGSKRIVLTVPHNTAPFHYGGTIQFGPKDRLLYIGTGDAEDGANLLDSNAQNTKKSLLGKILRIDPHKSGNAPYSIPADNPFSGQPLCNPPSGATDCPEVVAWGLRNPFRWSFDRATGDIAIGDVGQDAWEEIEYVPASATLAKANFGWPCYEGVQQVFYFGACSVDPRVDPVFWYSREDPGLRGFVAITGGVVVRDPGLGSLVGRYLWADFFVGAIRSLQPDDAADTNRPETDLPKVPQLVSFSEDSDGHVYVVQLQKDFQTKEGSVQRLVCTDCTPQPVPGGSGTSASGSGTSSDSSSQQPGPTTTPDKTPPRVSIRAARLQNVLRSGVVRVAVTCNEACVVRATGRAGGLKLHGVLRHLRAHQRAGLELRASERVRRSLARHGAAILIVRARDGAGNLRIAWLTVRVKRR